MRSVWSVCAFREINIRTNKMDVFNFFPTKSGRENDFSLLTVNTLVKIFWFANQWLHTNTHTHTDSRTHWFYKLCVFSVQFNDGVCGSFVFLPSFAMTIGFSLSLSLSLVLTFARCFCFDWPFPFHWIPFNHRNVDSFISHGSLDLFSRFIFVFLGDNLGCVWACRSFLHLCFFLSLSFLPAQGQLSLSPFLHSFLIPNSCVSMPICLRIGPRDARVHRLSTCLVENTLPFLIAVRCRSCLHEFFHRWWRALCEHQMLS